VSASRSNYLPNFGSGFGTNEEGGEVERGLSCFGESAYKSWKAATKVRSSLANCWKVTERIAYANMTTAFAHLPFFRLEANEEKHLMNCKIVTNR
jgi:hypothetical protein